MGASRDHQVSFISPNLGPGLTQAILEKSPTMWEITLAETTIPRWGLCGGVKQPERLGRPKAVI
jgi:hypothetical protein